MEWVRRFVRTGASVALFALALQFVVSFGHVHLPGVPLSAPASAETSVTQAASGDGGTPSKSPDRPGADDFCSLCASIVLAGSLLQPVATALIVPTGRSCILVSDHAADVVVSDASYFFNARAPPEAS
jgi:hypothetical protein